MMKLLAFIFGMLSTAAPHAVQAHECISPELAIGRMQVFLDNAGAPGTVIRTIDPKSGHLMILVMSPMFPQPSISEFIDGCLYSMDGMTIEEILSEIPETRRGVQS